MKKNTKGFTLAEVLIVVAIIAVLVAISIPIFTTQLHKSRVSC
ncbi:MAG: prepilin-type N-terminal cleavage/methylation domain-containing protein [Bulleidia sp.]|nr:prepilin-type N-terminal cleavage/methylation domain-containing protein [Bulleidia sp.]